MPHSGTCIFSTTLQSQKLIDFQRVNFCCCWNRGSMTLTSYSSKNTYSEGAQCSATAQIKNDSTEPVKFVKMKIYTHARYWAQGHSAHSWDTVVKSYCIFITHI